MRKPVYILGINCYFHDSSACILRDGKLIAMVEEERFTRIKHTSDFPIKAINFCLESAGIKLDKVSFIAYGWLPWRFLKMQLISALKKLPYSYNLLKSGASYMPISKKLQMTNLASVFKKNFKGVIPQIKYISHHDSHAYSAYWVSEFKESAILVIDGFGEDAATSLYYGKGNNIKKIVSLSYYDSLGAFYGAITQYLGFRAHNDEYKVMGMAAYGQDKYSNIFKHILKNDSDGMFKLDTSYIGLYTHGVKQIYSKKLVSVLGPAKEFNGKYLQKHFDIACSAQKRLEEIAVNLSEYLYRVTGSKNLCIAGGVAQNVLMNSVILEKSKFKQVYVPPVAYDGGCSLGAAFAVYNRECSGNRDFELNRADWGPSYTTNQCFDALKKANLTPSIKKNQSLEVAKLLAKGKIVGYFDGAMEIGPRALGNRSILADPRKKDVKDVLNSRIKKREFFRPFAPMVTYEDVSKYFEIKNESPFMTMVGKVINPELLPGITHADGTARVQTVKRKTSPNIYSLLKAFKKITGVSVLLNTSFNENEPIVCTPEEAIDCYKRTKMDALVFNNQLLVVK